MPEGEEMVGFIRVPLALCGTRMFTKARSDFNKYVSDNLKRWIDWKARQGWYLVSKPKVTGPFDPPTARPGAPIEDLDTFQEHKRYMVHARFKRDTPKWIALDSMLWVVDKAELYGIDLRKPINDTGVGDPKPVIIADEPAHDPLQFAEERRKRLGLKREDYLLTDEDKTA